MGQIYAIIKEKANQIPTRKSLSKDEINLLEESFPKLIVAKELIPTKRKSKTDRSQGSNVKERKTGNIQIKGYAEQIELWKSDT